jgi:hypothetical protein
MFSAVPPILNNTFQKFKPEPPKPKIKPFPRRNIENLKSAVEIETIEEAKSALLEDYAQQTIKQVGQAFRPEPERENIIQYRQFSNLKPQIENDFINSDIKTILQVNDLLRSGNFVMAEHYLGRELTSDEKINRSISGTMMKYQKPYLPTKWTPFPTTEQGTQTKDEINSTNQDGTRVTVPTTIETGVDAPGDDADYMVNQVIASLNNEPGAIAFTRLNKPQLLAYAEYAQIPILPNMTIPKLQKAISEDFGKTAKTSKKKKKKGSEELEDDNPYEALSGSGFVPFGNFKIHMGTLNKPNPKLSVYYNKSGKRVVYFHPMPSVSKTFVDNLKQHIGKGLRKNIDDFLFPSLKKAPEPPKPLDWKLDEKFRYKDGSAPHNLNPNERELWDKLFIRAQGGGTVRKREMTTQIISNPTTTRTRRGKTLADQPHSFSVNVTNKPKRLTILLGEIDARGGDKQATATLVQEAIAIAKDLLSEGTINKEEYSEIIDSIA